MKLISIDLATLASCVQDAQQEQIVLTHNGKPVALMVGVEGMEEEQLQLGASGPFWQLIAQRRTQATLSRAELEQKLDVKPSGRVRSAKANQRRRAAG